MPAVGVVDESKISARAGASGIAVRGGTSMTIWSSRSATPSPVLPGDAQHVARLAADQACDLLGVLVRLSGRQVDFVEHGDDVSCQVDGHIQIGQGLRLDALGAHRRAAPRLRELPVARDTSWGEVHVAGGIQSCRACIRCHQRSTARARPGILMVMPALLLLISMYGRGSDRASRSGTVPLNCRMRSATVDLP